MGLRIRKTFPLGKLFRFTLSKPGVSLGVGPRGANVNIGPRSVRSTVGIPGTGAFYQENKSWPKTTTPVTDGSQRSGVPWLLIVLVVFVVWVVAQVSGGNSSSPPSKKAVSVSSTPPPPPAPSPTVVDRVLTHDEVRELQSLLKKHGFDAGSADGIVGPRTRAAVHAFIRARGLNLPDEPTLRVLEAARSK